MHEEPTMGQTWVVVADGGAARIFAAPTPTGALEELETFVHPEGRLPERELTSDLPGRSFASAGHGRRTMESEVGPRKQAAIDFARLLAARIEAARGRGEVERLILVAAPEFLGHLRDVMGEAARRLVEAEHTLNLVKLGAAEIRSRLPQRLYSTLAAR
jgi:protein required for attachment to host cells